MHIANRWDLPDLGVGIGLRTVFYPTIKRDWPKVDWFEVISENFLDTKGMPLYHLDMFAERYPIVLHGVSMSIGSTDPLNMEYLAKLKALAKRIDAPWIGDHLCWTGVGGVNGHDLLPVPYNEETLSHVVERIRIVQDVLERPLVLENPSTYATFTVSTMGEPEFIARMAEDADCALLLDVNNVYVQARNHDFDPFEYLAAVPWDRVTQIHLAGHTDNGDHCIDTHDNFVCDPVWALYAEALKRAGSRSTLLEWDDHYPEEKPFETVWAEAKKAEAYRAEVTA
jgi:uncharacterized protein (UPF0276 family)